MIELNWTREQVLDQVDMPFLQELRRVWAQCPPLRRLLAASLGFQVRPRPSQNYHELVAMFPGGAIR
ncbi:MAG: hypothetical protein WBF58_11815 [Xanthobacteraceae bacterium]